MFEFSGILTAHIVWKLPKNVSFEFFNFSILAISINFCPIKIDLSGNIVWEQVKGLKNSPNWPFLRFQWTFVHSDRFTRNVEWDLLVLTFGLISRLSSCDFEFLRRIEREAVKQRLSWFDFCFLLSIKLYDVCNFFLSYRRGRLCTRWKLPCVCQAVPRFSRSIWGKWSCPFCLL